MVKKKDNVQTEAVQEETATGTAPVAFETAASVAEDTVPSGDEVSVTETSSSGIAMAMNVVTVLCWPGTEELVKKIWKRFSPGLLASFRTVPEGTDTAAVLADIVADETVPDKFVLVMPGCVPCCHIDAELGVPVVYVEKSGKRIYDHGLPMEFDKEILVDVLAQTGSDDAEVLLKSYGDAAGLRPVEVGMSFGNYVTPVRRAAPCENRVIEALLRKKFLLCSPEGFSAIRNILEKHAG